VAASGHCGIGGRSRSGALFLIYDSLIDNYTGTGNVVDLATASTTTFFIITQTEVILA